MKIYLNEIKDLGTDLDFNQDDMWLQEAVSRLDERLDEDAIRPVPFRQRPVQAHFNMRMVDEVYVVTGGMKTSVQLLCSRCIKAFDLPLEPRFNLLFCKDPVMAGIAHLQRPEGRGDGRHAPGKPVGQNAGFARHAHDEQMDLDVEAGNDIDITYISNDFIDLGDVVTEQLTLQVPFQPLCKEDCKGMCAQCGADLNVGRCACAKIATSQAFSVLKDWKAGKS